MPSKTEKKIETTIFVVYMCYIIAATVVYTAERFALQETFLSFQIRGL